MSEIRTDFIDFPTAWELQRRGLEHTDQRCSAVQDSGFLCDCGAIETAWKAHLRALAKGATTESEAT